MSKRCGEVGKKRSDLKNKKQKTAMSLGSIGRGRLARENLANKWRGLRQKIERI